MILFILLLIVRYGSCNLMHNTHFQNTAGSVKDWTCDGCEIGLKSQDGRVIMEVNNRTHTMDGPSQYVPLKPDSLYTFRVSVRQKNDVSGNRPQTYRAAITYTRDSGAEEYRDIARHPEIHDASGWFTMETAFNTPKERFTKAFLSIHGPEVGITFQLDNFTLIEVPKSNNWVTDANARIEKFRKINVHFMFSLEPGLIASEVSVKIDHIRHLFGFGALADTQRMKVTGSAYMRGFRTAFQWATVDAFKWPLTDNITSLQDEDTIHLLNYMRRNGLKIRGQSLYHGKLPGWVENQPAIKLAKTMTSRMQYLNSITKGLIDQWVVADDSFEDTFYKPTFTNVSPDLTYLELMYQHNMDPDIPLYINEMDVLVTGNQTGAYTDFARRHIGRIGLSGIGAKSSFIDSEPDPDLLKLRLDILAKSKLPIWITDLEVHNPDEDIRATLLENAVRMYFSHPDVEGITLSNFFLPFGQSSNSSLFEEVELNGNINNTEAGQRFLDLTMMEWSTHITRNLGINTAFTESCFQGTYYVRIFFNGTLAAVKPFTLNKVDTVFGVHISSNREISMPRPHTAKPPSATVSSTVAPDNRATSATATPTVSTPEASSTTTSSSVAPDNLIASAVSPATHLDLQCVTRWSKMSGPGYDETVDIGCHGDEVLTGCSSSKIDPNSPETHDWYHDGEFFVGVNGSSVCRATNGFATKTGVYAVARCCSARDLSCQYLSSEPSLPAVGAIAETTCPSNYVATGCSGLQKALGVRGVSPNQDLSGCLAVDGEPHYGVLSAASCCSAPGLKCVNVTSSVPYVTNSLKVTCEDHPGTVMTSCHAKSAGKIKGVYISDSPISACRVSGEEPGIEAVAVCCHVDQTITVLG